MSSKDERSVSRGFPIGIGLLFIGAFFGGIMLDQHEWIAAAINLLITVPFSIGGLRANRETYKLIALIKERSGAEQEARAQ
jgi:hypothetical protein